MALLILLPAAAGTWIIAPNPAWGNGSRHGRAPILAALSGSGATPAPRVWPVVHRIALGLAYGPGEFIGIGAHFTRGLALGRRLLNAKGELTAHELEQFVDDMILNGRLQFVKHTEGFVLELDQWIALPN